MDTFLHRIAAHRIALRSRDRCCSPRPSGPGPSPSPYAEILRRGGVRRLRAVGHRLRRSERPVAYLRSPATSPSSASADRSADDTGASVGSMSTELRASATAVEHLVEPQGHGADRLRRVARRVRPPATIDSDGFRSGGESPQGSTSTGSSASLNYFDDGRKLTEHLITAHHAPTAVVCVSDVMGLGVMAGLRDRRPPALVSTSPSPDSTTSRLPR